MNTNITFDGTLTDQHSNVVNLDSKLIHFYIYGVESNCIYYAESSSTSGKTDGAILHKLGTGTRLLAPTYSANIFGTTAPAYYSNGNTCTPGNLSEYKNLRVSVPDFGITTDLELTSVPYALNAETFSGKIVSDFILTSSVSDQVKFSTIMQGGASGQVLSTDVSGNLQWTTVNAAGGGGNGDLLASLNLSDLSSSATARTNLGLRALSIKDTIDLSTDITGTLPANKLETSGVTAGTYGSANGIPSITVDIYGRVTALTSNAYQYATTVDFGIVRVADSSLTLSNGLLSLTSQNIATALGYTPANPSNIVSSQWVASGTAIQYSNHVGIGPEASTSDFGLSISGTTIALSKIGIKGSQVLYLPDQNLFLGSIFIGDGGQALSHASIHEGRYNTAIGLGTLYDNTTGSFNTAIGLNSLAQNTSGERNTSLGAQSLSSNTTGQHNASFGYKALFSNTSGYYNTSFGTNSLLNNQQGNGSTALGYETMVYYNNAGDSFNTAVGTYSMRGTTTYAGTGNTALGHSSLYLIGAGSNNTSLGYRTGYNISSGSRNTFLGYTAGYDVTTGSNNVIIGSDTGSDITTSNNNVILSDGAGNRRITINSSGHVGIGTTSPKTTLDISGIMKMEKYSAAPVTCDSDRDSAIALTSKYTICICKNGTGWVQSSDGTTACTWN